MNRMTARSPSPDPTAGQAAMAPDELECLKERTLDRLARCLARFTGQIARDWAYCGKAACARARRCRGFACEPDETDE